MPRRKGKKTEQNYEFGLHCCQNHSDEEEGDNVVNISIEDEGNGDYHVEGSGNGGFNAEENDLPQNHLSLEAKLEKIKTYVGEIEKHRALVDHHQAEILRKIEVVKTEVIMLQKEVHRSSEVEDRADYCGTPITDRERHVIPEMAFTEEGCGGSSLAADLNLRRPEIVPTRMGIPDVLMEEPGPGFEMEQPSKGQPYSRQEACNGTGMDREHGHSVRSCTCEDVQSDKEVAADFNYNASAGNVNYEELNTSIAVNAAEDIGPSNEAVSNGAEDNHGLAQDHGGVEGMTEILVPNSGKGTSISLGHEVGNETGREDVVEIIDLDEDLVECGVVEDCETQGSRKRKSTSPDEFTPTQKRPVTANIFSKLLIPNPSMLHSIKVLTDDISDEEEVVCDMFSMKLEKGDLMSLMPRNYVNTSVVHVVAHLLNSISDNPDLKTRKIRFDPGTTGFIVELDEVGKKSRHPSKLWNKIISDYGNRKLSSADMIFFPVVNRRHWFVLVLNLRDDRIDVLDCETSDRINPFHRRLVRNMRSTLSSVLSQVNHKKARLVKTFAAIRAEVPKSDTGCDCGIWAIVYMHLWEGKMVLPLSPDSVDDYGRYYIATLLQANENTIRSKFRINIA